MTEQNKDFLMDRTNLPSQQQLLSSNATGGGGSALLCDSAQQQRALPSQLLPAADEAQPNGLVSPGGTEPSNISSSVVMSAEQMTPQSDAPSFNPAIFGHHPPPAVIAPPDQPLLEDEQEHYDAKLDERYERLEGLIGEGTYGKVYKAKDLWTGKLVALKKLSPRNSNLKLLMRELSILRHVQHHPSIVSLVNVFFNSKKNGRIDLVTEYLPTNLMSLYQSFPKGYFPVSVIRCVMLHLVQGLQFLKDRCVVHRDVKPSNILVELSEEFQKRQEAFLTKLKEISLIDAKGSPKQQAGVRGQKEAEEGSTKGEGASAKNEYLNCTPEEREALCVALMEEFQCEPKDIKIKLCDFGSARMLTPEDPFELPQMNTPTNTCSPCWRSPEQFLASQRYDHPVDMWAAGCIMAELFLGDVLIYCEDCDFGFLRVILQLRGTPKTPQEWEALLLGIETFPDYYEPPQQAYNSTVAGLMELPKFKETPLASLKDGLLGRRATASGALDLMDKMLALFPHERITPAEALQHPFFFQKQVNA